MTRKIWMAAALALAMVGGTFAQAPPSHPVEKTEKTEKAKKHKKVKKSDKKPATSSTQ